MISHKLEDVRESAEVVRKRWSVTPRVGIILGSGLGGLAEEIDVEAEIPYASIPHFPVSTVQSHKGALVCGRLAGAAVAAMEGRFHLYEGYSAAEISFPVRVFKELGCTHMIVSNASGGLNPLYAKGDLVVIEDHINLLGANPLTGPNDDRLGPRFPDMIEPYDKSLQTLAMEIARGLNISAHRGVYSAVLGPNLETRAEYRYLRAIGADLVGMSTIPEVITAVHAGLKVLGFSIVTDMCLPDALHPVSFQEIVATATEAEAKLRNVVKGVLQKIVAK